nr:DUF2513 domain-containing protein [Variovorax boronicumulans]
MKRNWDVIRELLIEVEALDQAQFEDLQYGAPSVSRNPEKAVHMVLLWKAGFVEGVDSSSDAGDAVIATGLTWAGHDLLETMRSKPVWDQVKKIAQEKGIELTFDAVKTLGRTAFAAIIGG